MSIACNISCIYLNDRMNVIKRERQEYFDSIQYVCGKCGELFIPGKDFCSRSHDFWICENDLHNPDLVDYCACASISREKMLKLLKVE